MLTAPATKLGSNGFHYIRERLWGEACSLDEVLRERGEILNLGGAWVSSTLQRRTWKPVAVLC